MKREDNDAMVHEEIYQDFFTGNTCEFDPMINPQTPLEIGNEARLEHQEYENARLVHELTELKEEWKCDTVEELVAWSMSTGDESLLEELGLAEQYEDGVY